MGDKTLLFYDVGSKDPVPDVAFVGLVNGADVPLLALDLPKGLRGKARYDVAVRQVQDQLGRSAQGVEIIPFASNETKGVWSHVILKPELTSVQSLIDRTNCDAVLPDYLALPAGRDVWTIDVGKTQTKVRLGLGDGFTAEHDLAAELLTKTANSIAPLAILRLGGKSAVIDKVLRKKSVPICTTIDAIKAQGLPAPAALAHHELAMDLRQTPATTNQMEQSVRGLIWPAIAAVLALGIWSTSMWLTLDRTKSQTRELRQQTQALVRTTFVPNGPILDIRAQVSQALADARNAQKDTKTDAPLDVLRRAGAALEGLNGTIESASYSAAEGLILRMALADFAALDLAISALTNSDLSARVGSSDTGAENVVNATVFVGASE